MTPQEAILIAKYVAAVCPQQRFNEHTPDVWGDILAPYDVADARLAVVAVASRQPFISPAEIITEIKDRRAERIAQANLVYDGNPLESGAESTQSVRALIRAAAAGDIPARPVTAALDKHTVPELPPGRAAAILGNVGNAVPRGRRDVVNPRGIACRHCGARPGSSCTAGTRRMADVHPARLDDAKRLAAGLPPVDPEHDRQEQERIRTAAAAHLAEQPETGDPA